MGTRLVIEKPAMTYGQAAIAEGAEAQQYGGADQKAPKAPTDVSPRFTSHMREAHLEHRASARDLQPRQSSSGPRIGRRNPEDDYARAVSRTARYGMRDAGLRTDAERRMLAGIESGDRAFIDEVARGIVDAAIDIPSLAGMPTNVGQAVLDAVSKWGKGGGGRGGAGGRAGGEFGGGGGGSGIDASLSKYLPPGRTGPAGNDYGLPGGLGSGSSGNGAGGFAEGFTGSRYFPNGRAGATGGRGRPGGGANPRGGSGSGQVGGSGEGGASGVPQWIKNEIMRGLSPEGDGPTFKQRGEGAPFDKRTYFDLYRARTSEGEGFPHNPYTGDTWVQLLEWSALRDHVQAQKEASAQEALSDEEKAAIMRKAIEDAYTIATGGQQLSAEEIEALAKKKAAEEEEKRRSKPKSNPNPEDPDGDGPVGPWIRERSLLGQELTPNPEDPGGGGPIGPWLRSSRADARAGVAGWVGFEDPSGAGPRGPWIRARDALLDRLARIGKPNPDDPHGPAGPNIRELGRT